MKSFLDEILPLIEKEPDDWYHFTCKDIILVLGKGATTTKMLKESLHPDEWRHMSKYHTIFERHIREERNDKIDKLLGED